MDLDDWDCRLSKLRRTRVMLGMLGWLPLGCDQQTAPVGAMRLVGEQAGREVGAMRWGLGLQGLGLLIAMSLGLGIIAQLVAGRAMTRWLWLLAAAGYFLGGLFTSEVWFGWATQEELQPNIDGLSFDEVQLFGLVSGIVTVLVTWYVTRRTPRHQSNGPSKPSGTPSSRPPATTL